MTEHHFRGSPESALDAVQMAMASTNELFNTEVFGNRNFDALDAVDTTDARILPPGAPMVFVRDVVEIGCATLTAEPDGQSAMQLEVKLRGVLAAGRRPWKGHVDIWNPNA